MPNRWNNALSLLGVVLILSLVQVLVYQPSEPFFNNDETRHVMTGVFFRDFFVDSPLRDIREYTIRYYLQYPALGLLVWPPFFYFIEGLFMLFFGTSFLVSKIAIGLFAVVACGYLFQLVCRTHDTPTAVLTVLIFGFSPLFFSFSHQVMLEVPTLALGIGATYHFVRYLDQARRRDLLVAALLSVLTILTRFDGVYLIPLFLILLVGWKRLAVLQRKEVIVSAALALFLALPFCGLAALEFGHYQVKNVILSSSFRNSLSLSALLFYPSLLPLQLSVFAVIPTVVGVVAALKPARRGRSWPYLAMVAVTYVIFTSIAEREPRHTIYWLPAFALFAADGVTLLSGWLGGWKFRIFLACCVVGGEMAMTLIQPRFFVQGYEEVARYVLANSTTSRVCFFEGGLDGNFTYQIRHHDSDRRLWILRADRLLYNESIVPSTGYVEIAKSEEDILATIFKYDPEFIIVEEPRSFYRIPMADRLRDVLRNHPERFRLETVVPIYSNNRAFRDIHLKVYRNLLRNAHPETHLDIEMLALGRTFQTVAPSQEQEQLHQGTESEKQEVR